MSLKTASNTTSNIPSADLSARRLMFELKSLGAVLMADDLRRYHDQMLDIAERLADEEERLYGDREHLRLELRELRTEIDRQRRMLNDIRSLRGELADEESAPANFTIPSFHESKTSETVEREPQTVTSIMPATIELAPQPVMAPSAEMEQAAAIQNELVEQNVGPAFTTVRDFSQGRRQMPSVQALFGKTRSARQTPSVGRTGASRGAAAFVPGPTSRLLPVNMPARNRNGGRLQEVSNRLATDSNGKTVLQPPPVPKGAWDSGTMQLIGAPLTPPAATGAADTVIENSNGVTIPFFETPIRNTPLPQSFAGSERMTQADEQDVSQLIDPSAESELRPAIRRRSRPFRPDFRVNTKWWNVAPMIVVLGSAVGFLLWTSTASLQATLATHEVQDLIERPPKDRKKITEPINELAENRLGRWDARRDYISARGMALAAQPGAKSMSVAEQTSRMQSAYADAARAVRDSPANLWYRLSLAQMSDRVSDTKEVTEKSWEEVKRRPTKEPLYWKGLAQHLQKKGLNESLDAYREYLKGQPESTAETFEQLSKSGATFDQLKLAIPSSVIACSIATEFFRQKGFGNWQATAKELADRFPEDGKKYQAEEWAARANLLKLVQRNDEAITSYQQALAKAGRRNDWRIQLAKLYYEKGTYADCEKLANIVLQTEPASTVADEARLLKERIALSTGEGLKSSVRN